MLHQRENGLLDALHVHAVDIFAQPRRRLLHHGADHLLRLGGGVGLGRHLQQTVALLGIGGHRGIRHAVHLVTEHLVHGALADAEDAQRVRHDLPTGELLQIGQRALGEHRAALLGRAGDHDDGLAVLFKGAARRRAAVVVEHGAALGQHGLGIIVRGKVAAVFDIVIQSLALGFVFHQR